MIFGFWSEMSFPPNRHSWTNRKLLCWSRRLHVRGLKKVHPHREKENLGRSHFFLHEWPLFSTILTKTFSKLPSWGMKPTKDEGIQVKISVVMASYGLCSIWKIQLSPSLPLLADPVRDTCPGQAIAEQLLQLEFVKKKWALVVLVCSCGMYLIVF